MSTLLVIAALTTPLLTQTINDQPVELQPDTTIVSAPTQCDTMECFFKNTNIEFITSSDGTKVLVRTYTDATEVCDFARSIEEETNLTLSVLTATGTKTIGKCK